jgi:hypothetical protein
LIAGILAGTIIVALLAWLAINGRSSATRLEDGLRSGAFGGLAPTEEGQLLDLAVALLPIDRRQPRQIIINKVAPHTLRIFTFTKKASQLPGFGMLKPGNAVYNAELDTIFLDRDIVREALGEISPLVHELRFYVSLLILHEDGHREKHAALMGFFDGTDVTNEGAHEDKLEIEADDYALTQLRAVYRPDLSIDGLPFFGTFWNSPIVYGMPSGDGNEFWRGLFSTAHMLPLYYFVRGGDFSAIYADKTHPTLLARLRRLVAETGAVFTSASDRRAIDSHRDFLRNLLDQSEEMRRSVICEVRSLGELVGATWSKDGLMLLDRRGYLSVVPYRVLDERSRGDAYCIVAPTERHETADWTFSEHETATAAFVQLDDNPILVMADGRVYRDQENRWHQIASLPALVTSPGFSGARPQLYTSNDPKRRRTLALQSEEGIAAFSGDHLATMSNKVATQAFCERLVLADCPNQFELAGVGNGRAFMSFGRIVGQKGEQLAGVAELVMTEQGQLELGATFTGRLPAKDLLPSFHVTVSPDGATMLAHGTEGKPRVIAHPSSGRPLSSPYGWSAWQVSSNTSPAEIARHRYTAEFLPLNADGSLMRDYEPWFRGAIWLTSNELALDYGSADPLYLANTKTGFVALPSPSPDYLEVAPDRPWFTALIGVRDGTHRAYILKMNVQGASMSR